MVNGLADGGESTQSDSNRRDDGRTRLKGNKKPARRNPKPPKQQSKAKASGGPQGGDEDKIPSSSQSRQDASRSKPSTSTDSIEELLRSCVISSTERSDDTDTKSRSSTVQSTTHRDERSINLVKQRIDALECTAFGEDQSIRLTSEDFRPIENHFIDLILKWSADWLRGRSFLKQSPPGLVGGWQLEKTANQYESAFDYCKTYLPLLLNEMWTQLYEEAILKKLERSVRKKLPFITIQSCSLDDWDGTAEMVCHVDHYIGRVCCSQCLREKLSKTVELPEQGHFIKTFVREGAVQKDFFGYVTSFELLRREKAIELTIKIHPNHVEMVRRFMIIDKPIRVQPLCYMKPSLRHLSVVAQIVSNPLAETIFRPIAADLKWNFSTSDIKVQLLLYSVIGGDSKNTYNEHQKKAIIGCLNMALDPDARKTQIRLIQGPPGTGKTHTLMAILKGIYLSAANRIFYEHEQDDKHADDDSKWPRILICAPSHEAVDEVTRRLVEIKSDIQRLTGGLELSFIRFAPKDKVNPDIVPYTLHSQAEGIILKNLDGLISKLLENEILDEKESDLKEIIDRFLRAAKVESKTQAVYLRTLEIIRKIVTSQDYHGDTDSLRGVARRMRREYGEKVIGSCHVILSTLNSTHDQRIADNMPPRPGSSQTEKITFDYLIVDEACQCAEPESLMPLHYYKIRRAILIGDPLQLPATVLSNKAKDYGYQQSFFERLYNNYKTKVIKDDDWLDTLVMLNTQYRMNHQIVSHPSGAFYGGKLKTWEGLDRNSLLVPYLILDLDSRERRTAETFSTENRMEAELVINLLSVLCDLADKKKDHFRVIQSVGIVTPYKGQKMLLEKKMKQLTCLATSRLKMDLNTVDGFQGQERDVIIYSCVRSKENKASPVYTPVGSSYAPVSLFAKSEQRLNVALTRARYAMFVVMNGSNGKLTQAELWKRLLKDAAARDALKTIPVLASGVSKSDLKKLILRKS